MNIWKGRIDRLNDYYTVHWPRWNSCIWIFAGTVLIYFVLDVHFFKHIPGVTSAMRDSILPTILVVSFGLLCLIMGGIALISPPLILNAGPTGITIKIYRIGRKAKVRTATDDGDGELCFIPWKLVATIAPGTIKYLDHNDCGRRAKAESALVIRCDPSLQLGGYKWGDGDVMFGEDGCFLLNATYLPGSVAEAVKTLSEMKRRYS
jgi:hypothetical protein